MSWIFIFISRCWECHRSQPAQYVQIGSAIHFCTMRRHRLCSVYCWTGGAGWSVPHCRGSFTSTSKLFYWIKCRCSKYLTEFQLCRLTNVKQIDFNWWLKYTWQAKFTLIYCLSCTYILDSQSLKFRFKERKEIITRNKKNLTYCYDKRKKYKLLQKWANMLLFKFLIMNLSKTIFYIYM